MKNRKLIFVLFTILIAALSPVLAQTDDALLIDDFEMDDLFLSKDADGLDIGYVSWGDTSNVELALMTDADLPEATEDNTVLSVVYNIAQFGGFTHAFNDEAEWTTQDWTGFSTFEFWFYGTNSGTQIQVEIFDNRAEAATSDSAERWFYRINDDFDGWAQFSIPFDDFRRRTDWQPSGAPNDGLGLEQVHGYAFSFPAGTGEQTNFIDNVMVSNAEGNVPPAEDMTSASASNDSAEIFVPDLAVEPVEYNPDGEWELVWSDEFEAEADAPINGDFWTCEIGGHGWGNNQLEHNTNRIENVAHNGEGFLVITAREEEYQGNAYTSARCNTNDKVEFTFGKVEARIDLPEGQGMWPAFWMLGANFPLTNWPDSGEIDIMEYVGHEMRSTHGTIHGPGYSGGAGITSRYIHEDFVPDGFHVYGIEWEPDIIRFYVDEEIYFTVTPDSLFDQDWVFNDPFFMIINVAVGGNWPGSPNATTVFPQEMLLDWVRVYQRQ